MRIPNCQNVQIDILMATRNSSKFLNAQIDSIISQTHTNWQLLIRDDASTDNTVDIISQYTKSDPRIHLLSDDSIQLGTVGNFERLMTFSTAPYIMFSDHDDVWLPMKIEILIQELVLLESNNFNSPAIVHCEASIANEFLELTGKKFVGKRSLLFGLNSLLFEGIVQGSSMIFNRALLNLAIPFPPDVYLHDYYLSLINEAFGKRKFIKTPLMTYRIHSNNALGTTNSTWIKKINKIFTSSIYLTHKGLINTISAFSQKFSSRLTTKQCALLSDFQFVCNTTNNKIDKIYKVLFNKFQIHGSIFSLIFRILVNAPIKDYHHEQK